MRMDSPDESFVSGDDEEFYYIRTDLTGYPYVFNFLSPLPRMTRRWHVSNVQNWALPVFFPTIFRVFLESTYFLWPVTYFCTSPI